MSNLARNGYALAVVLALVGAVAAVRLVGCGSSGCGAESGTGTGGAVLRDQTVRFTIAGDAAKPLAPGVMAPVNLEVTNPHPFRMWVTDLRMRVQEVTAPRADGAHTCTRRDFAVEQAGELVTFRIPAHTTRTIRSFHFPRNWWPQVGMLTRPVNQDGCKGAALTLAYTGSGERAR